MPVYNTFSIIYVPQGAEIVYPAAEACTLDKARVLGLSLAGITDHTRVWEDLRGRLSSALAEGPLDHEALVALLDGSTEHALYRSVLNAYIHEGIVNLDPHGASLVFSLTPAGELMFENIT